MLFECLDKLISRIVVIHKLIGQLLRQLLDLTRHADCPVAVHGILGHVKLRVLKGVQLDDEEALHAKVNSEEVILLFSRTNIYRAICRLLCDILNDEAPVVHLILKDNERHSGNVKLQIIMAK